IVRTLMRILTILFIVATCAAAAGEVSRGPAGKVSVEDAGKVSSEELIGLAGTKSDSREFREAVLASLPEAELKKGTAFVEVGPDFLCVLEADVEPKLYVDDRTAGVMKRISGTNLWYSLSTLATGTSHE